MADELARDDRDAALGFILRFDDRPAHTRNVFRQPAVHLAVEVLDDLRPPLLPPLFRVVFTDLPLSSFNASGSSG